MKEIFAILCCSLCLMLAACSDDDSFTTSPSNILTFSIDTVKMDTVFSTVPSSTHSFWVYNRSGDGIRCTTVRLANGNQTGFRVNVDGEYLSPTSGYQVHNVEIRDNDSIRVFVELTSPVNGGEGPQLLEDDLIFMLESGREQKVNLNAYTWDALLMKDIIVSEDATIGGGDKPIVIYGGLEVDSFATLRILAGTTLYFHADAGIDVFGKLLSEGTADNKVVLRGDRTDWMFNYLPYDMVSGQWQGVKFHSSSYDNILTFTDIHGTFDGIVCDSSDVSKIKLQLYNSTVHNCQGYGLKSINSNIDVRNCQITNTLHDCMAIYGGSTTLVHCTIAQFYPFDSNRGMALRFSNKYGDSMLPLERMECINSIVTGYGTDLISGENHDESNSIAYNYRFINSLLRTKKIEDDENIINVIWEDITDEPNGMDTVMGEYNFEMIDIDMQRYDFHLSSSSYAIDKADKNLSLPDDHDGNHRDDLPDIGCYEFLKTED